MKRIITFIITLCLCLSLTSCGNFAMVRYNPHVYFDAEILFDSKKIPDHSDNFDEEFFESFDEDYVYESYLGYYSASEWEAEEECDNEFARVKYRFSMIDGFEDKQFIARSRVHRSKFPALADVYCDLEIFRHKDAPDPIKDWTIKSFSVILVDFLCNLGTTVYETDTDTKNHEQNSKQKLFTLEQLSVGHMSLFDTEARCICTFDRENDPAFIEMIEKGYAEPRRVTEFGSLSHTPRNSGTRYDCYAVIRFEESDNIVWYCPIQRNASHTELYLITPVESLEDKEKRAVIDGEYAEKILNLIWEWQGG